LLSIQATTSIESPAFVRIWNLLDVLSILSDDEQCHASLLFWLVEELLDSQAIPACRKILDYLESRRERITAKHFKDKQLVILRSCNELLRRLSRAEDTSFCGRVFIFMFQSFPLGDKSSVNLRGEFHVENVTTYDQPGQNTQTQTNGDAMEVDKEDASAEQKKTDTKAVSVDSKKTTTPTTSSSKTPPMDADTFYPIFWSLQESFSQPKKLFDAAHFAKFKTSMETAMSQFKTIEIEPRNTRANSAVDDAKKSLKRKRGDEDDDNLANAFNPKYLTSRDLFELEV
jgi:THO complex subunit 1